MVQWTAEKDQIVRLHTPFTSTTTDSHTAAEGYLPLLRDQELSPAPCLSRAADWRRYAYFPSPSLSFSLPNTPATDCTPKAVSHRLANLRNTGKPLNSTPSKGAGNPKAATTPKTPKSRAKKQKLATPESDSPEGLQSESDGLEQESPLASKKRKRATPKKTVDYKETSGEDESQEQEYIPVQGWRKVKKEPIEDVAVTFGENVEVGQGEEEI
jgi:hypothetical protein